MTINLNDDDAWQIDTVSSTLEPVLSEDHFSVNLNKVFDDIDIQDYHLIILPGIIDFTKVINNNKLINFIEKLNVTPRPLIASISSSPILLAKGGLLKNVKSTAGLYEETLDSYPYLSKQQLTRTPVHYDKEHQIITAIGFAFREFAIEVLRALNYDVKDTLFTGTLIKKYSKEDLTYRMQ